MDPTGLALLFGGIYLLILGLVRDLKPPKWGSSWPGLEPRWHDKIPARWCYRLAFGLIIMGILW